MDLPAPPKGNFTAFHGLYATNKRKSHSHVLTTQTSDWETLLTSWPNLWLAMDPNSNQSPKRNSKAIQDLVFYTAANTINITNGEYPLNKPVSNLWHGIGHSANHDVVLMWAMPSSFVRCTSVELIWIFILQLKRIFHRLESYKFISCMHCSVEATSLNVATATIINAFRQQYARQLAECTTAAATKSIGPRAESGQCG